MRNNWAGCGTALVTPFTTSGAFDEVAVRRLTRRQIDGGIHFLVPCGTTGESPTLSDTERQRVVEIVVDEAAGRIPVLAGAGGHNTREVIGLAREMERVGASGLLSVAPYYNKPSPEGMYQHFRSIAESTALPIIVYNVPGRTGCNIDVATLVKLAAIPNIVGVKEASANMTQMCEICRALPGDFNVLSGDDAFTLPLMAVGGRGVISVAANEAPTEMAQMVEAAERSDFKAARALHTRLLSAHGGQLRRVESDSGQGGDGPDGTARGGVSLADGAATRGLAPEDRASLERPGSGHGPAAASGIELA